MGSIHNPRAGLSGAVGKLSTRVCQPGLSLGSQVTHALVQLGATALKCSLGGFCH